MNKNLYRLVFNARRGQMMAVAETAGAQGKSASGETTANTSTNSASNGPPAQQGCAQAAIKVIAVSMLHLALLAPASAQAQIRADASAPGNQQPQIITTANGLPQVNIQAPSAAGVSRNVYSQFDINAQGAILNNSRTNVQTQLGGWVQSNGNLAGGAARVILNEVNSSNPSQLKGFVEVAGQRAEVIIANPSGINVDGGGFINASGVTLTTGAAQINNATGGSLDSFRVQQGVVTINGAGLDSSQAAVAMINNHGDIGKTLDQLGKEESIKNLVFTMLTAGALGSLSESLKLDQINVNSGFAANVGKNAITNLASASMDAALNGKPLNEDTLSKALSNALIAAGAAQGAHAIGDAASATMDSNGAMTPAKINAFTQSVAHALLGCAVGSASAGSGAGCSPGAVGAVVGELSAKFFYPDGKASAVDTVNFAKTMASLVGAMSGGGTEAVSIASMTGGNAAENNYLKHAERLALNNAQKACFADGNSPACGTVTSLKLKDELSTKLLANAAATCEGAECNKVSNFDREQQRTLGCTGPATCPDYNTLEAFWSVAQRKAQGLEAVYPEGWVMDAKAVLDLGKFGVRLIAGASGGAGGSLEALGQLAKTDATTVTNNFYRDGSNPAYWTLGKPGDASLNLATHWEKHGAEFPNFNSANAYYKGATDFVTTPPAGTLVKTSSQR